MNEKKNEVMEEVISGAIVRRYFQKLEANLAIDVAIVGAGPSGLVAAHDLPEGSGCVPYQLLQKPADCRKVAGIVRFGIGTFLAPEDFFRQIVLHRLPQQPLFIRTVILVFPRHAVEIFRDAVIAEGNAHFQPVVHGHAVFSVKQGLHEPMMIEGDHFLHAGFERGEVM